MGERFIFVLLLMNLGASASFGLKRDWAWMLVYLGATVTLSGSLWLRLR